MRNVGYFLLVGATAAAIHQVAVIVLVETGLLTPAMANLPGFAIAWLASYLGHRHLTFRSERPHREAAPRFLVVALLAFAANQALYVLLLRFTPLHYAVALFIVLIAVAVGTYLLSGRWAFRSAR